MNNYLVCELCGRRIRDGRFWLVAWILHILVLVPTMALAATETVDGIIWEYEIANGKAQVGTGRSAAISTSTTGAIIVPSNLGGCLVASIGEGAFYCCSGLTSVTISEGVTNIGRHAFRACSELTSVTIPSTVTSIGDYAFYDCSGLTSMEIPEGVTNIGDWAFYDCSGLTSVMIPSSVTSIGNKAFMCCSGLTSAVIPGNVKSFGDYAFASCSGLTSVMIAEGVTNIGNYAFWDCSRLMTVSIPSTVTSIGRAAFVGCYGLKSMMIPDGVMNIGDSAFSPSGLTTVTIPSSVTSIGDSAFSCCTGLVSFSVAAGNSSYKSENGMLLTKDGKTLVQGIDGGVSIPECVVNIGKHAFTEFNRMTSMTIPAGVTDIGDEAFLYCRKLAEVTVPKSVTNIGVNAFYQCPSLKTIHVSYDGDVEEVKQLLKKSYFKIDGVTFIQDEEPIVMPVVDPPDGTVFKADNCQVSIACATTDAAVYFRIGAVPKASSKYLYSLPFTITDTSTIYAYAMKDGKCSPTNVVTITKGHVLTFVEAANVEGIDAFTVGGDADWIAEEDADAKFGAASVHSGMISDEQISWFSAEVRGPGTLSFWWKASCEGDVFQEFDHLVFAVDDVLEGEIARLDGITAWEPMKVDIPTGTHTLYWAYVKDECDFAGEDCGWVDGITWMPDVAPVITPTIEGDEEATVIGDPETGFVIKPSVGNTAVEVTIPQGVDAAKVTVEVSPKVATVKPNGAKVKVVVGENDITGYLVIPERDGVMNIAAATVKEEIVKETLDPSKDAVIELDAANPKLITAPTRKGLFYQLREGVTLGDMKDGDSTIGDGEPWAPEITVKGGNSAFYSIGVGKGE